MAKAKQLMLKLDHQRLSVEYVGLPVGHGHVERLNEYWLYSFYWNFYCVFAKKNDIMNEMAHLKFTYHYIFMQYSLMILFSKSPESYYKLKNALLGAYRYGFYAKYRWSLLWTQYHAWFIIIYKKNEMAHSFFLKAYLN